MRNEAHPLLVEDILSRDVGGHISSNRVSDVLRAVGVELTTRVTVGDVDLGSVPEPVDLDVLVGLDELQISNIRMNKVQGSRSRQLSDPMRRAVDARRKAAMSLT